MAAVEHCDVVQTKKPALKNVIAFVVDFVYPPGKIDEQFMKAPFEEVAIRFTAASSIHVVNTPYCPGMNRWIEIRELPLVSRDLAVRMLKLLKEQMPQLVLRKLRIHQRERHAMKCQIPGGKPRVLPLVRHRQHPH